MPNRNLINRYPGGRPFSEDDSPLFFGRKRDLANLNDLMFIKQMVVLFGKSGYGKSSLINAGIIPLLKNEDNCIYFLIRFNNYSNKDGSGGLSPVATVIRRLSESITTKNRRFEEAISENSFWYWIKQHQFAEGRAKQFKYFLFFEQFEELFTYPKEEVVKFSEQLSQLLYSSIPVNFRKSIDDMDKLGKMDREIEEIIYEKPELKIVFSIRSDRLSQMNVLSTKHPSILQNCYELDALDAGEATAAIVQPAKLPKATFKSPRFNYENDAIDKILNSVTNTEDGKIETASLQIICRYVEENLVLIRNLKNITSDALGDVTDIFQQYYESVLSKFTPKERESAQVLIEEHLTDGNRRYTFTGDYIKSKFGIQQTILDTLEQSSLLKKERDAKGRYMYEIGHDTIVTAVNRVAETTREIARDKALKKKEDSDRQYKLEMENRIAEQQATTAKLQKAVRAYQIAVVSGIVAVLLVIFSVIIWRRSKNIEDNAFIQKNAAATQIKIIKKNKALHDAKSLMNVGDEYLLNLGKNALSNAAHSYQSALDSIKEYPSDTLYVAIKRKLHQLRQPTQRTP